MKMQRSFTVLAASPIDGLGSSLDHACEDAARNDRGAAVLHYVKEAQRYLSQIRSLHQAALDEFARSQGE
jgi:hypothetical protein